MAKGSVLWRRTEFQDDEIWDDTEMIAAYNRAVSKIKDEISRRSRTSSETQASQSEPPAGWKQGDYCIAVYSGDHLPYEAKIKYLKGKHCTVHYIGYGNEERVLVADLHPSEGRRARLAQRERAESSVHASASSFPPHLPQWDAPQAVSGEPWKRQRRSAFSNTVARIPSIPPPPPPPPFTGDIKDNEALSSMLMSWYMSGYHTGFYQALQQAREEQKTCCHEH
uniref:Putative mrna splicing protein smn survival motor neuron n=1 Tax=Ixodes ricinus TaxID=34613 RepID=A0A131Y7Z8_IXORI